MKPFFQSGRASALCLIVLCVIVASPAVAQKAKHFERAEAAYAGGDYARATKFLSKYRGSLPKAGGEKYWSAYWLMYAKVNMAQGLMNDFTANLEDALNASIIAFGDTTPAHAFTLISLGEIYNDYGYPRKSREYLAIARPILKDSDQFTTEVATRLALAEAEAMIGQGWATEAIRLLRDQEKVLAARAVDKETSVENGTIKSKRVPESELPERFGSYARCLMLLGAAYSKRGSLLQADSAFKAVDGWLQGKTKYLGETNVVGIENRFRWAYYMIENGNTGQRERELQLDVIMNDLQRRIKPTNQLAHDIYLTHLHELLHNENRSQYNNVKSEYQKVLDKYFPKKSLFNINMDAVEFDARLSKDKLNNVEFKAVRILEDPALPPVHRTRMITLRFLYDASVVTKQYAKAEKYLTELTDITKELCGETSPEYHLSRIYLANFFLDYTNKIDDAKNIYEVSYHGVVEKEIAPRHKDILIIYNHLATLYELTDQYALASQTLKQASESAIQKYRSDDILYGIELSYLANLHLKLGEYDKAQDEIRQALGVIDNKTNRVYFEQVPAYVAALETQARLYGIQGLFDEAQENLEEARKVVARANRPVADDLTSAEELSGLLIQLGRYSDAEALLTGLFTEYEKRYGTTSIRLIQPLVEKGRILLYKGDYTGAEQTAQRAYKIAFDAFGDKSTKTAPTQKLLSDIYYTLGDYEKAEAMILPALTSQENQFGRNHIDVARSIAQLALIRFYKGDDLKQVERLMLEAKDIMATKLGEQNPQYADILKHVAVVYLSLGNSDVAFGTLSQAESIWRSKAGTKNNINLAGIYTLTGDVHYQLKDFKKAKEYYEKSRDLYEKFFTTSHPEYVKAQAKLSKVHYMQKNFKTAKKLIEEVLSNYERFIRVYFPALSEREKAKYWNTIKGDFEFYNTLAFSNLEDFKDLTGNVYNYQLLTKALLLSSSIKIRERIMNSSDEELKASYSDWVTKKELLTLALSMSAEQLIENEIEPATLQLEVERIEKKLSERSEDFAQGHDKEKVEYGEVARSLEENEVAVEIVRYRYFDHVFTDSIVYAALYVRKDLSRPKAVVMGNGSQMEGRYFKYYRNAITGAVHDEYSYDVFWKPIRQEIGLSSAIYFSADGVYNQINLEAIPTPDGKYVLDNTNIVLVSNTRDLYRRGQGTRRVSAEKTATMFGNPTFYVTASSDVTINSLPGTEQEVTQLDFLLKQKGWTTHEFIERSATEEQVKDLNSPRIFHVATHGLYKRSREIDLQSEIEGNEALLASNPLLRTGLLLKGAGDVLNKTDYNYNIDNGILTAYEAMSLNLDQTDLVVLSACETGLGDVEQGEGVYGLQRAFLVAGARMLIMSMFKVDDRATQQLMVKFYQKWLNSGMIRESFTEAKKELRAQYPDPLYWGAFMMIGLE